MRIDFYKNRIIAVGGAENHEETYNIIKKKFEGMPKGNYPMDFYPEKSAYVGGEKRITMEEAEQFGIGIAFETCGWSDQSKSHLYFILEWLYGEATGFSVGGPGRGMHARSHYTLVNGRLVEETERIFMPFADTGLFGLVFIMPGELFGKEIN